MPPIEVSSFVTDQLRNKSKNKLSRACDICRRRKIRCEGADITNGSRCANCAKSDLICTYVECAKKRAPSKSSYVESLEAEVMKLRVLLQKVVPDVDLSGDLDLHELPQITKPTVSADAPSAIRRFNAVDDGYPKDDSILIPDTFPEPFQTQSQARFFGKLSGLDSQARFLGKSSGVIFLKEALARRPNGQHFPAESLSARRAKYWVPHPWEEFLTPSPAPTSHQHTFPPPDLMLTLTDLYFELVNLFSPLLHRPTFDRRVERGEHHTNMGFACVVLMVCAVGARFSDDPRVRIRSRRPEEGEGDGDGEGEREKPEEGKAAEGEGEMSSLSCGWKWFNQAHKTCKPAFAPATLEDLQIACLSVEFLQGASAPTTCWTLIGVAIRQAQDVGAHRWKTFGTKPKSIEQELWKRAWWSLVSKDRIASSASGRPCITQDEDYDIGLPTECDDEYWDHPDPDKAWKQPEGVPSTVAYFNSHLKMSQILAHTLSSLYRSNKSESDSESAGPERGSELVMELDSALNKWVDSIPDHLKWNPSQPNLLWRRQSLALYAHYYLLQISIHRPFISSTGSSLPSLAICTNAARACSHLINLEDEACVLTLHRMQWPVFSATVVLLLNLWSGKRSGLSTDHTRGMKDVNRCMQSFRFLEKSFQTAGKLWDLLDFLMTAAGYIQHPEDMDTDGPPQQVDMKAKPKATDTSPVKHPVEPSPQSQHSLYTGTQPQASDASILTGSGEDSAFFGGGYGTVQQPVASGSRTVPLHGTGGQGPSHDAYPGVPGPGDIEAWESMLQGAAGTVPTKPDATTSPYLDRHPPGDVYPATNNHYYPIAQTQNPTTGVPDFTTSPYLQPHPHATQTQMHTHVQMHGHPTFDGITQYPSSVPVQDIFDAETMQMWTTAPLGFEADAWGSYISNVNQIHMMDSMDNLHVYSNGQQP